MKNLKEQEPVKTRLPEGSAQAEFPEESVQTGFPEEPAQAEFPEESVQTGFSEEPARTEFPEESVQTGFPEEPVRTEFPEEPIKYATPVQRVWAWVGVVYMIFLVLLTTYGVAHGDFIRGIGGLMLSPALVGLGVTVILRHRLGQGRGGKAVCVLISGAAFALALWNCVHDIPILIGQLGG